MSFGEVLQQLREEAALSQTALARAAGLEPSTLNRLERGQHGRPRLGTVLKLARGMGLSPIDERVQQLLIAAGYHPSALPSVAPRPTQAGRRRALQPLLQELHSTLLRAVQLVAELQESVGELDQE